MIYNIPSSNTKEPRTAMTCFKISKTEQYVNMVFKEWERMGIGGCWYIGEMTE